MPEDSFNRRSCSNPGLQSPELDFASNCSSGLLRAVLSLGPGTGNVSWETLFCALTAPSGGTQEAWLGSCLNQMPKGMMVELGVGRDWIGTRSLECREEWDWLGKDPAMGASRQVRK